MTRRNLATGPVELEGTRRLLARHTRRGGKMRISKKKLVEIIREAIEIKFKQGTSEKEKEKMLLGLFDILGISEEEE